MKVLVLVSLLVAAEASTLQSYSLPLHGSSSSNHGISSTGRGHSGSALGQGNSFTGHGTTSSSSSFAHRGASSGQESSNFGVSFAQGTNNNVQSFGHGNSNVGTSFEPRGNQHTSTGSSSCRNGEVLHVDGTCVVPEVTRNFYAYTVPDLPQGDVSTPYIPPPRVEHNILFVRLPEGAVGGDPIIVPPPRQNNIVYILKKKSDQDGQVIHIPEPQKTNPEVYFVNYIPGENPTLPGGIDLQTALSNAAQGTGQVIGGSGSNGFGSSGLGHVTGDFTNRGSRFFQSGQATNGFGERDFSAGGFRTRSPGISGFGASGSRSSGFDFSNSAESFSNTGVAFGSGSVAGSSANVFGNSNIDSSSTYRTP